MPQTAIAEARVSERIVPKRHFVKRHWLLLVMVPALFAMECIILALNWPFQKQDLIDILQERSGRSVTIGRFERTYFPPAAWPRASSSCTGRIRKKRR
jgi:hypothetical protein